MDSAGLHIKTETENFSQYFSEPATIGLTDPFNNASPKLQPKAGSPALTGAKFDLTQLQEAFFNSVAYRGALDGTNDWTSGWAVWGR